MLINLLKKKEQEKISLFNYIISQKRFLKTFQEKLINPSYHKNLVRNIDALNQDLENIGINSVFISTKEKNYSIENKNQLDLFMVSEKLTYYYLQQSSTYQILSLVLKYNNYSILKLANTLSISHSHCYYLFKELNNELKVYNVQLTISKGTISLSGNEANILFFIYLFSDTTESLRLNSQQNNVITQSIFKNNLPDNSYLVRKRLDRIYKLRRQHTSNITIENKEAKKILLYISKQQTMINLNFPLKQQQDLIFYDLFFRIIFPGIDNQAFRTTMGEKLIKNFNNPFVENASVTAKETLQLNPIFNTSSFDKMRYELTYILCLQGIYLDLLKTDSKNLFHYSFINEFFSNKQSNKTIMKEKIEMIIKHNRINLPEWTDDLHQQKEKCFSEILSPILFSFMQPKLIIFTETSSNFMDTTSLERQLLTIFSDQMIEFTTDILKADIVITDHILPQTQLEIPHFSIYDKYSMNIWNELLTFIIFESQKKLLNYT